MPSVAFGSLTQGNESPTLSDTLGDSFTLGASNSVQASASSASIVQQRYLANCNSANCGLAYSSSVTAGNTLVYGLGWSSSAQDVYVPITITNNAGASTPGLDGKNYNTGTGSTLAASLTTSSPNDVIIAIVTGQNTATGTYQTPSISDSAGLSWSARSTLEELSSVTAGCCSYYGQVFYAIAASPLSSDSITVTWNSAPTHYGTLQVFGVSGANTASPFDSHSGLPAFASGSYPSVTTSNANDFVYGAELTTTQSPTAGTGFTGIETSTSAYLASEYEAVSSTQSGLSVSFSNAGSTVDGAFADAIQAAPTTSTPNPFQQMITWNPATYSANEATNLGNIRFCADVTCATPLNAWLESCSSTCSTSGSTSTSATAWVKLTTSIAGGGGTLTIFMVFEPTSTNFDGVYWGEFPSATSTYGQYDNGANVFLAYANGNTAISSFTVAAGYTLAQATGVTFGSSTIHAIKSTGSGTFGNIAWALNTAIPNQGLVVEGVMQHIDTGNDVMSSGLTDSASSSNNAIGQYSYYGGSYFAQEYSVAGTKTLDQNQAGTGTTAWIYSTVTYPGSSSTTYSGYIAPQFYSSTGGYSGTVTVNPFGSSTNLYVSDPFGNGGSTPNNYYVNFDRARAYPPTGVMPSTSIGSLASSSFQYVAVTLTNNQGSATPAPFQQMITWNPSTYSGIEATNLGNIRFCADAACVTPLNAWLESCSSTCSTSGSSSTSATAWVKLTTSIAGSGGTLTIYMVFEPTSTNFDGVHWGEFASATSIYAQYDNGANVFQFYSDFSGSTLPSSLSTLASSGTAAVNNGLTLSAGSGAIHPRVHDGDPELRSHRGEPEQPDLELRDYSRGGHHRPLVRGRSRNSRQPTGGRTPPPTTTTL